MALSLCILVEICKLAWLGISIPLWREDDSNRSKQWRGKKPTIGRSRSSYPIHFFCLSLLTTSTSAFFTLLGVEMWPARVYPTSDSKNKWIASRSHCTPWHWQLLDTGYEYFARRRGKVINLKRTFTRYILVRELNIFAEWLAYIQAQMFLSLS